MCRSALSRKRWWSAVRAPMPDTLSNWRKAKRSASASRPRASRAALAWMLLPIAIMLATLLYGNRVIYLLPYLTIAFSGVFDQWIALAYLERGTDRIGEKLVAASPVRGTNVEVEVCSPVFFDPQGERLRA